MAGDRSFSIFVSVGDGLLSNVHRGCGEVLESCLIARIENTCQCSIPVSTPADMVPGVATTQSHGEES